MAKKLIFRYGKKKYYTIGQIDTTIKKYNIKNDNYKYFQLLFLSEIDYQNITGYLDYVDRKKSLYLFLNENVSKDYIKNNDFVKMLDIDINKFGNYHTAIEPNSNISGFHR